MATFNQFKEMCENVSGRIYKDTLRGGESCVLPGNETLTASNRYGARLDKAQVDTIIFNIPIRKEYGNRQYHITEDSPDAARIKISTAEFGESGNIEIGENGVRGSSFKRSSLLKRGCKLKTDFQFVVLDGGAVEGFVKKSIDCDNEEIRPELIDLIRYHTDGNRRWLESGVPTHVFKPDVSP